MAVLSANAQDGNQLKTADFGHEIPDQHSCWNAAQFSRETFSVNGNYEMEAVIQIHQAYVTL